MYVDVEGEMAIEQRVTIMRRALSYGSDVASFRKEYAESTKELATRIAAAIKILPQIQLSDAMLILAAQMVSQALCAGHRAEIYLLEAAKALAALAGRSYVLPKDIEEAALYVLPHRMRKPPEPQESEESEQDSQEQNEDDSENNDDEAQDDSLDNDNMPPPPLDNNEDDGAADDEQDENEQEQKDEQEPQHNNDRLAPEEQIADIDKSCGTRV